MGSRLARSPPCPRRGWLVVGSEVVLRPFFHAWERRLAAETTNRVERPFEWGLDWLPGNGHGPAETPEASIGAFADRALAESDTFFTAEPTNDYRLDRDGVAALPERAHDAPSREQRRACAPVRGGDVRLGPKAGRGGPAAVECGPRRAHRVEPSARALRHHRAAVEPSLPRRQDAARAPSRRLHREREHRPDAAGLPPGGPRHPAGARLAGGPGLRAARGAGHQPRLVPRDAHGRPRHARPGGGAQSCVPVLRRCGVGGPLDDAHQTNPRRARQSSRPAAVVGANQPEALSGPRAATRVSCSSTRSTT